MFEQLGSICNLGLRHVRKENPRFMFWSVYYPFNFGDWIGPYLYIKKTKSEPWFKSPSSFDRGTVYMTAGSIMGFTRENSIVWGSGIMSRKTLFPRPHSIRAVRGPYTKELCDSLGYDCPEVFGDPGLTLPSFYNPDRMNKYKLGIIPHYTDMDRVAKIFSAEEIVIIDVRYPIDHIIDLMNQCECIVSSSLHGIILSHAYSIPVGWVSFDSQLTGDGVKFLDHFGSLGEFSPQKLDGAINIPIDELISFAQDMKHYDTTETVAQRLLQACPF
ncbi:polysaccharide pyruvyl transferase family protein [Alteromonas facilis]|uniref:polysaccharide pyruvyl transferase family protein n=1 Tax=Alteromonas facilis TaxID=2048004 RepID=UPI000C287725|nr:polysaccharide pyruvyl transferase family protein [Alteromonas facilis]